MQFMNRPRHDPAYTKGGGLLLVTALMMLAWCIPLAAQTVDERTAAGAQSGHRAEPRETTTSDGKQSTVDGKSSPSPEDSPRMEPASEGEAPSSRTATDMPSAEGASSTVRVSSPDNKSPLPHELSPLGMFMSADIVVKAVMISLLFASVCSWTVWMTKSFTVWISSRNLRAELTRMRHFATLADAAAGLDRRSDIAVAMVGEATHEVELSCGLAERAGINERVASRLDGIEAAVARSMRAGTGLLASVGATAPFVGLFGTVWGIMNSFIGISRSQTTNLAVVAPGIAEALLATAIGLVAAIPAVLFYNVLARALAGHRALTRATSAEVQRLVSRDLDRGAPRLGTGRIRIAAE